MFEEKRVLITGGTGSWGYELVKQLIAKKPAKIIIFSRNEFSQVIMKRRFNSPILQFVIGDVRDYHALENVTKNIDYIFHLAALKHVPICESQPDEAIKTNIEGVENLIKAAVNNRVVKVIDVSTDKAVLPLNVYGMTKSLGERLIIHANTLSETGFVCIRAGNVLGTNGSVVPYFIKQAQRNEAITLTDPAMTRFFLTLQEAISLLFKASEGSVGGETFVMKMPGFKIFNIAKVIKDEIGNGQTAIKVIGKRPGEKVHEVLISKYEAENSFIYDQEYFVILSQLTMPDLSHYYNQKGLKPIKQEEYTSNDHVLGYQETKEILRQGGFI